ncbi:CRISPR-associated exonuclease Cas4 [anaerobic digester metagenome]
MSLSSNYYSLTTSDLIEFLFCPRFIYYLHCLGIAQNEEQRFKVQKGRDIHRKKEKSNAGYLRKDLKVIKKIQEVYMSSEKLHTRGIVDEVLFFEDGTASPLDYKFAEYKEIIFRTNKYQSVLYAMMIEDFFNIPVKKGFVVYARSNHLVKEISITSELKREVNEMVQTIFKISQTGFYPKGTSQVSRCIDCCYRRICDHKIK